MRNNRRAGKPAGRKPEKQGLTGLFTKGKNIPTTAQQTLPYREMYRDGVCRVADRYYTKTIEYEDINYQLAQSEDQAAIFDGWSACLNYFDSSLPFQLSFLNHRSRPGSRYSVNIPMQDDDYNSVRCEYVEMLENQIPYDNGSNPYTHKCERFRQKKKTSEYLLLVDASFYIISQVFGFFQPQAMAVLVGHAVFAVALPQLVLVDLLHGVLRCSPVLPDENALKGTETVFLNFAFDAHSQSSHFMACPQLPQQAFRNP